MPGICLHVSGRAHPGPCRSCTSVPAGLSRIPRLGGSSQRPRLPVLSAARQGWSLCTVRHRDACAAAARHDHHDTAEAGHHDHGQGKKKHVKPLQGIEAFGPRAVMLMGFFPDEAAKVRQWFHEMEPGLPVVPAPLIYLVRGSCRDALDEAIKEWRETAPPPPPLDRAGQTPAGEVVGESSSEARGGRRGDRQAGGDEVVLPSTRSTRESAAVASSSRSVGGRPGGPEAPRGPATTPALEPLASLPEVEVEVAAAGDNARASEGSSGDAEDPLQWIKPRARRSVPTDVSDWPQPMRETPPVALFSGLSGVEMQALVEAWEQCLRTQAPLFLRLTARSEHRPLRAVVRNLVRESAEAGVEGRPQREAPTEEELEEARRGEGKATVNIGGHVVEMDYADVRKHLMRGLAKNETMRKAGAVIDVEPE